MKIIKIITYRIKKNINEIESKLFVKIQIRGKTAIIEGDPLQEELAALVLEAIDLGFPVQEALMLRDEDFMFTKLSIKEITKRHDLERVRARLIGTKGMTLRTLEDLTGCSIVLHDNFIGIIGRTEDMISAVNSIKAVVQGLKESSVFSMLDRREVQRVAEFSQIKHEADELEEARKKAQRKFEKARKAKIKAKKKL